MHERQQPDRDPGSAPHVDEASTLKIETPVIQMQDLEHRPPAETRVNTKGVKINPPAEPLPTVEIDTLERDDEKRKLPPG